MGNEACVFVEAHPFWTTWKQNCQIVTVFQHPFLRGAVRRAMMRYDSNI